MDKPEKGKPPRTPAPKAPPKEAANPARGAANRAKPVAAKSSKVAKPPSPTPAPPAPKAATSTPALAPRPTAKPEPAAAPAAAPGPVLWVASEAIPLASTGGLGDVVGALPSVLRGLGWDIRVCLPYYRQQIKHAVSGALFQFDLALPEPQRVVVRELLDPPNAVPTYLIDCPALFDRPGLYVDAKGAFADNPFRFGVFQLAILELAAALEPRPAIIHSHDWHASLLPALVRLPGKAAEKLHDIRTLFTIHNLQYQGDTERGIIDVLALPPESWSPDWAEHYGRFLPVKAAIMTADRVTTVSPTYAEELRGPSRGQGLDGVIRARGHDMRGLINGIDDVAWNPATDKSLAANFSSVELAGREACKRTVRAELGLADKPERPLIGFIGRLVGDKGVDLIMDALPDLLKLDVQIVILGSGDNDLENRLRALEAAYVNKGFRGLIKFDLALSRRLYSAFDVLLVPSRLEPCGLVQLYALRYGAVPVVHGVGGLRDTVIDGDNGFVFHAPTPQALADAVGRAVALWKDRAAWVALQQRGMQQDWSWKHAAAPYDALYREVLATPVRRQPLLPTPIATPVAPPPAPPPPPLKIEAASFRLMVQGPRALFAYWDLQGDGPYELVVEERPSGVIFTAAADLSAKGERWMGALPDQAYRALLRGRGGQVVALSNAVVTPLETPPEPQAQQPPWLESAVEVGVFEHDTEGRRWAAVFPEAATFSATKDGELAPHWPHDPAPTPISQHQTTAAARQPLSLAARAPLQVPSKDVSLTSVSYPRINGAAHSGTLVRPLSIESSRSLNLSDVVYKPSFSPVSGNTATPSSASFSNPKTS